jgi:hypothetical protein
MLLAMPSRQLPSLPFAHRLDLAIDHWPEDLEQQFRDGQKDPLPGRRGLLAQLAGMPAKSMLADMTSGRTPGHRYRQKLAEVLRIDLAWLEGDDQHCPDWVLSPLEAWERFSERLGAAWKVRAGIANVQGQDDSRAIQSSAADEDRIARILGFPLGHRDLGSLSTFRYAQVSDETLSAFAAALGLPPPSHPHLLAQGRQVALVVEDRIERTVAVIKRRYARFLLPPRLFKAARLGLVGLKAQRVHQGRSQQTIDDCLEVLWRQELLLKGRDRAPMSIACQRETGRQAWTPLSRIRARYSEDEDIEDAFHSTVG